MAAADPRAARKLTGPQGAAAAVLERAGACSGSDVDDLEDGDQLACQLVGPEGRRIPIPDAAFFLFERVAEVLARGDSITIVPIGKELTTQQAADLLNVSRQYLVRLLDEKRLPYTKLGKHRRLRIEDVVAFKEKRDEERRAALEELTELSEDAGRYSEIP